MPRGRGQRGGNAQIVRQNKRIIRAKEKRIKELEELEEQERRRQKQCQKGSKRHGLRTEETASNGEDEVVIARAQQEKTARQARVIKLWSSLTHKLLKLNAELARKTAENKAASQAQHAVRDKARLAAARASEKPFSKPGPSGKAPVVAVAKESISAGDQAKATARKAASLEKEHQHGRELKGMQERMHNQQLEQMKYLQIAGEIGGNW